MTLPKKTILSQITPGNYITIAFVLVSVITAWSKIQVHLQDDTQHVGENEVVLTIEEYKNLLKFANTVSNKFSIINKNQDRVIELEKQDAVHRVEYEILYQEMEGLESKVSRNYTELNNKIDE